MKIGGYWSTASFTLPSHIPQESEGWYLDTTNGNHINEKWIRWYCKEYYKKQGINYLTGQPIKRRKRYVSKIDWDLEDKVIVVKQIYKEI